MTTEEIIDVTTTSSTRLGALALGAVLVLSACSSGGASTAPSTAASAAAPTTAAIRRTRLRGARGRQRHDQRLGLVDGRADLDAIAEPGKAANPASTSRSRAPAPATASRRSARARRTSATRRARSRTRRRDVCQAAGIEYIELKIAYDGITVMTSPDNTAVECLSFADLYALTGPESQGFDKWSTRRPSPRHSARTPSSRTPTCRSPARARSPAHTTATSSWSSTPIGVEAQDHRPTRSTRRPGPTTSPAPTTTRSSRASPARRRSLGWVGFAFAQENKDKVKELGVAKEPNGTCVEPTAETIADGTYPISRSLYIYVNKAKAVDNPAVAAYVDYYLADGTI